MGRKSKLLERRQIDGPVGTPKVGTSYGKKIIKIVDVERIDPTGSLDDTIQILVALRDKYKATYSDMYITEYYEQWEETGAWRLCGTREETDLEYDFRINREREIKEAEEKKERAQYRRLKKKFEKTVDLDKPR